MPSSISLSRFHTTLGLECAVDTSSSSFHSTFEVNGSSLKKKKGQLQLQQATQQRSPTRDEERSSSSSSSSSSQQNKRRQVSFQTTTEVYSIQGMNDYSEEEKIAVWFTHNEMQVMKRERRATVKIMERCNHLIDDNNHYFRGLEFKTRDGFRRKQWNVIESTMVVFDEQMIIVQQQQQLQLKLKSQQQSQNNNDAGTATSTATATGADTDTDTDSSTYSCCNSYSEDDSMIEALSKAYKASTIGSRVSAIERAQHDKKAAQWESASSSSSSQNHKEMKIQQRRLISPSAA